MKSHLSALLITIALSLLTMPNSFAGQQSIAMQKVANPCNPCAKKQGNPCNPCAGKQADPDENKSAQAAMKSLWQHRLLETI